MTTMEGVADALVMPIAGFIIIGLLSVIGFGIKKMLTGIYSKLDSIGDNLNNVTVESKLLRAEISEINKINTIQFSNIEGRLILLENKQAMISNEVTQLKENINLIRRHHYQHHPDDNINIT